MSKRRRITGNGPIPYIPPEMVGEISSLVRTKMRRSMRLVSRTWNRGVLALHSFCEPNGFRDYYVEHGDKDILAFLYENGADIHYNLDGDLIRACMWGSLDMVKWLVDQGAHIHAGHSQPFLEAMVRHHVDIMEWIVQQGMDIHKYGGFRCFHKYGAFRSFETACERGDLVMAKWMKAHGFDIHAYDDSALRMATRYRRTNICVWFEEMKGEEGK